LRKKKQKTFIYGVRDGTDKSFLVLFFKKELLPYETLGVGTQSTESVLA
jgi:hypothetical protein